MEALIEHTLKQLGIDREQFESEIEAKRALSPIVRLQEENALMVYDSMVKDFKITALEQEQANLAYMVMMGGM